MDICDLINTSRDPREVETAARTILRRLQESDPKIVSLSLTLTETCTKNCSAFPACIQQPFMDEIVGITHMRKGKQNALDALKLIQQWGKGFESQRHRVPIFYDTYVTLRAKGANFPDDGDNSAAAFDLPVNS